MSADLENEFQFQQVFYQPLARSCHLQPLLRELAAIDIVPVANRDNQLIASEPPLAANQQQFASNSKVLCKQTSAAVQ